MLDLQTNTSNNDNTLQKVSALYGYSQSEISENLKDYDIPLKQNSMRTKQLWNWIFLKGIKEFSDIRNMPKDLLNELSNDYTLKRNSVSTEQRSADGTIKWLLGLSNNGLSTPNEIETVFIPEGKRGTICVSSQVGCSLSCSFCHTGTMKLERNLVLEEITGQIMTVKHLLKDWNKKTEEKIVTNVVFMGMGEPLLNYDNVINSIKILCDIQGLDISKRKVTLSTSGIVNKIQSFQEDVDVNLAISLHAAFDNIRDKLVPINRKWPLSILLKELKDYNSLDNKKRITFEYIMLEGINDSLEDAKELIKIIRPLKSKINLIPFNPWPESKYNVSSFEKIEIFKNFILEKGKIIATIRLPRGDDILAACGQLKSLNKNT